VSFPAGEWVLRGHVFSPAGNGPFPAVVWNHGSERQPGPLDVLGSFYTSAGYVLFCPHRHGHGDSPGEYAFGSVPAGERSQAIELIIALHELYLADTLAAVDWLARQAFVDTARIAVSGASHGAIQAILATEADPSLVACVAFAPAAMGWRGNPELQNRLVHAVRAAGAPIFLLQAENDYDLSPSEVLGEELKRKGAPSHARVYPPYGESRDAGHAGFAREGVDVWGADVRTFLDRVPTIRGC
jgi:carboxymethylenebutenolidase